MILICITFVLNALTIVYRMPSGNISFLICLLLMFYNAVDGIQDLRYTGQCSTASNTPAIEASIDVYLSKKLSEHLDIQSFRKIYY